MCGIWGLTGPWTTAPRDDAFIKQAALAGSVRGLDGTGIIFCGKDNKTTYLKKAMTGGEFVTQVFNPIFDMDTEVHSVIGHNRAATVGSIDDTTAHPFHESHILGVHNGTLTGDWRKDLNVSKKVQVDSIGVMRSIASRGIKWTVANMRGAAALVWVDLRTQDTFVYRNAARPLNYTIAGNRVYYASEAGMLAWLLEKNHVQFGTIQSFEVGYLYKITGGKVEKLDYLPPAPAPIYSGGTRSSSQLQGAANHTRTVASSQHTTSGQTSTTTKNGGTLPQAKELLTKDGTKPVIKSQNGVQFRGTDVSASEYSRGILGEWAERGFTTPSCSVCSTPITDATYFEATNDDSIKLHTGCFNTFRCTVSPDEPVFRIIRDAKLKGKLVA